MGTVAVEGAALRYDVRGDGPCVVFVHGTGTHRLTFGPVLDALPAGHALVAYDRRGFGGSRGTLARRVDQLAEALNLDRERVRRWALAHCVMSAWWDYDENGSWRPTIVIAEHLSALSGR